MTFHGETWKTRGNEIRQWRKLKGGNCELTEAIKQWNHNKLNAFFFQEEIRWHFNPTHASHMGGAGERPIRTVRKVLSGLLKQQVLDDEGLQMLLCEVKSIINGRPLTKVSNDPIDVAALTPNHLLLLKSSYCRLPGVFTKSDCYGKRRWKQVQYLADIFWKRWTKEYLPTLQTRQKWHHRRRNLSKNEIVLAVDETISRGCWPIARVIETKPGKDGLVKSVKVKTAKTELVRPTNELCLLELQMQDFVCKLFMENKQFTGDSLFGAGCKSCKITLIICRTVWPHLKIV